MYVSSYFGYGTTDIGGGRTHVSRIYCKNCAKYADKILTSKEIKGQIRKDTERFMVGSTNNTKHSVTRHLESRANLYFTFRKCTYLCNFFLDLQGIDQYLYTAAKTDHEMGDKITRGSVPPPG